MLRRLFLLGLPLGLLLAVSSAAQALMLHDSSRLAVYSAEAEPGSRNSHPAKLEIDQLLDALPRVQARSGETGEVIELFPKKNREQMAERLAKELRRVEPDEELHLVSFRHIGSLFSSKRFASSARVFVEGGQLNLIFGQIDLLYSEFRDPERKVPPMGSRKGAASLKGEIIPADGVSLVNGRKDWVALALVQAAPTAPVITPAPHTAAPPPPPAPMPAPAAPAPAANGVDAAPAAKSPEAVVVPPEKSIEEKLQILKNLRDKELITEEEYVEKKREILDDL